MTRPIYTKVRNPVILGLIELQKKEAKAAKKKPAEEAPEPAPKKAAKKGRAK
jgi:hypothetical protein